MNPSNALSSVVVHASCPKRGGRNIDPRILRSLIWGPAKSAPNFGNPYKTNFVLVSRNSLAVGVKGRGSVGSLSLGTLGGTPNRDP